MIKRVKISGSDMFEYAIREGKHYFRACSDQKLTNIEIEAKICHGKINKGFFTYITKQFRSCFSWKTLKKNSILEKTNEN